MSDIKLSKCLFADLKTDAQRRDWFLLGRGVETGVIAPALQTSLANAYSKLVEGDKLIKQLQKRITELEAQVPKWISVDDRLPDTCAYGVNGILIDVSDIVVTNQGAAVLFDGYWCEVGWDSHDLGKRIQGVTHWMPLPSKGD